MEVRQQMVGEKTWRKLKRTHLQTTDLSTLTPACCHCKWLKNNKTSKKHPLKTLTLPKIYSILFITVHLQDLQMPFCVPASCTLCSLLNGHLYDPFLVTPFLMIFSNKRSNRLMKSKLLVLLATCRGSYFWKLHSFPTAFTQVNPQKDSNPAGKGGHRDLL